MVTRKVLLATAEAHPTYRADVRVLFGQALPRLGVQVDLLAVTDRHAIEPQAWPAGALFGRATTGRCGRWLGDGVQQLSLFARCAQGYDVLIVRDKPLLGIVGWLAARRAGIPFCYWMSYPLSDHYVWLAHQPTTAWARRAYLWLRGQLGRLSLRTVLLPRSDWVFVQTQAMQQSLRGQGLAHDRVLAVPMGVDPEAIPPPQQTLPSGLMGKRLAVYVGTLDRYRCPELMVDAALQIARVHPDFCLVLIGEADDPREHGWLQRYAIERGAAPWVHCLGRVPQQEALAWVQRAEFGFSPVPRTALTEVGSPTKALEYLACGIPVVGNDQPDQAWVMTQSGGGVVASFDADGLARAALTLLADPACARQRGAQGRSWVRHHRSYAVLAEQVAQALRAVCRARGVVGQSLDASS